MIQWLLERTIKLAQYGQGIGSGHKLRAEQAILRRLNHPAVIFDVGAHYGRFTQAALAHAEVAIHAFEPSQSAFAQLSERFAGNTRVVLNNIALGDHPGEQPLYSDEPGSELSSLYPRHIEHHGLHLVQGETSTLETLDDYCQAHAIDRIDLLKLDVEGHELAVLSGGVEMFERRGIAAVAFEFGGCNVDSRTFFRDFWEFFVEHNMNLARVTASGGLHPIPGYQEFLEQFRTTCYVANERL